MQLLQSKNPIAYDQAIEQLEIWERKKQKICWFLEHEPVVTYGQSFKQEDWLKSGKLVQEDGQSFLNTGQKMIAAICCDRGGGAVYHGPGQRVVYFSMPLPTENIAVFVRKLEEILFSVITALGFKAFAREQGPGVWLNTGYGVKKAGFIGLKVSSDGWVTHGLALNNHVDLSVFDKINVCGKNSEVCNLGVEPGQLDSILKKQLYDIVI